MSPEAKQAAREWMTKGFRKGEADTIEEGYARGYDAATAKLRDSVEGKIDRWFESGQKVSAQAMSPEAKQAADAIQHREFLNAPDADLNEVAEIVQQAINAATAKLREELDVARSELGRRANENAKLREELLARVKEHEPYSGP